jgi:hypothetical protein
LFSNPKLGVPLALLLSASMWFYVDRILVAYQIGDAATHNRPRGNLSDLYPRWLGARELLLHGRNPYSPEITREIQAGYYGRTLDPSNPDDPQDQQGFAYPVYVVFALAPTVRLPFNLVQRGFNWFLWGLTGASVLLWLRALNWRPSIATRLILVILTLGSIPAVQGIKLQQLSLLVAGLLSACAASVACGYLALAGVLLALAAIKPQLAGLPALWLMLWTLRDWRHRQRLAWFFGATMLLLFLGAEIVVPGWLGQFLVAVQKYHEYTHNTSILGWLFTPVGGNALAAVLLVVAGVLVWPLMSESHDSVGFGSALALVMALTVLVIPMFAPYNQVLLLPALMPLVRDAEKLWHGRLLTRFLLAASAVALFWPWVASVGLMLATTVLPPTTVQASWKLPFFTTFTMPVLVFVLVAVHLAQTRADRPLTG